MGEEMSDKMKEMVEREAQYRETIEQLKQDIDYEEKENKRIRKELSEYRSNYYKYKNAFEALVEVIKK